MGDGEEEESVKSPTSQRASDILQRLHQQAKQRKKQLRKSLEKSTPTEEITDDKETKDDKKNKSEELTPVKKKKKRKLSDARISNEDSSINDGIVDIDSDSPRKKSKKDKRKSTVANAEVAPQSADLLNGGSMSKTSENKQKTGKRKTEPDSESEDNDSVSEEKGDEEDIPQEEEEDQSWRSETGQSHKEVGGFTVIGDVRHKQVQKVSFHKVQT